MNFLSITLLIVVSITYLFHLLFFWMYETTDSWFYWAFSNYMKTGQYSAPAPYFYKVPSTMEPPLYSVMLYVVQYFPRADTIIHFFHLTGLITAGFFVFLILKRFMNKELAATAASVFLLIPDNLVYATNLLSEVVTIPAITIYAYFLLRIVKDKKHQLVGFLVFYSAFMTLLRYNLGVFLGLSMLLYGYYSIIRIRNRQYRKFSPQDLFSVTGIFLMVVWVLINHSLNGSWGLSNGLGKNLYDRIVWQSRLLPKEGNKDLEKLNSLLDGKVDLHQPWWPVEAYIMSYKPGWDETGINNLLQKVSQSAVKDNPGKYLLSVPAIFLSSYNREPGYPPGYLYSDGRYMTASCRTLGTVSMCQPIIQTSMAKPIWDYIVKGGEFIAFHTNYFINTLLLASGVVYLLLQKDKYLKMVALSYFLGVFIPTLTAHPDARYLYPLLPLKYMIIFISLKKEFSYLTAKFIVRLNLSQRLRFSS